MYSCCPLPLLHPCRWMSPQCTNPRTCLMGRCILWIAITLILCWWRRILRDQEPPVRWEWSCSSTSLCSALVMEVKPFRSPLGAIELLFVIPNEHKYKQGHVLKYSESSYKWSCYGAELFKLLLSWHCLRHRGLLHISWSVKLPANDSKPQNCM